MVLMLFAERAINLKDRIYMTVILAYCINKLTQYLMQDKSNPSMICQADLSCYLYRICSISQAMLELIDTWMGYLRTENMTEISGWCSSPNTVKFDDSAIMRATNSSSIAISTCAL